MLTAPATRTFALPWGDGERLIAIPAERITGQIAFTDLPPLADPAEALRRAIDEPIGAPPLRQLVRPGDRVALLFATRHTLDRKRVFLVCDGLDAVEGREFGFAAVFRSFDAALGQALEEKGPGATVSTSFPRGICWRQMPWREG